MTILEQPPPANGPPHSAALASSPSGSTSPPVSTTPSAASAAAAAAAAAATSLSVSSAAAAISNMISSVGDRYITPEYLAPLPPTTSEKSGKSPLQLLAQTCSQIGADTGSNKLLSEKSSDAAKSKGRSPTLVVSDGTTPASKPVSFKPYEHGGTKAKEGNKSKPASISSLSPTRTSPTQLTPSNGKSPSPSSVGPATKGTQSLMASTASASATTATATSSETTPPVIRSGMEVLAGCGHSKDATPLGAFRFPSALDMASNPAFRSPFASAIFPTTPTHAAAAAAAAAATAPSVCRDPYCRDPNCPTAMYNAQMAAMLAATTGSGGGTLPPGYAELLRAGLSPTTSATPDSATASSSSISLTTSAPSTTSAAGPYICNWMNGREGYCGKRHGSADELLQHLRTHTNLSTAESNSSHSSNASAAVAAAAAAAAAASNPLYHSSLFGGGSAAAAAAAAALHRSYAASSIANSLSGGSRFHPYAKPGVGAAASSAGAAAAAAAAAVAASGIPPSLSALGLPPTVAPPSPSAPGAPSHLNPSVAALTAGLAGAYSPSSLYALYGSRLASGALP